MAIEDHYPAQPAFISAEEALENIGLQLQRARVERGEEIEDVADQLRIKDAYIAAIELGDLSRIPGRPYALGFIRSYANHLGFDGEEVVDSVKSAESRVLADPQLHYRTPIAESRRPGALAIACSLVLMMSAYGAWYWIIQGDRSPAQRVAELPAAAGPYGLEVLKTEAEEPAGDGELNLAVLDQPETAAGLETVVEELAQSLAPSTTVEPDLLPGVDRAGDGELALLEIVDPAPTSAIDEEPEPAEAAAGASASELLASLRSDEEVVDDQVFGAEEPNSRIMLIADQPSWIQVRSQSRDYVRTRTLDAGERFVLPDRNDLALWTGNAGGLRILVDGREIGSLGSSGEVVRDISLDPSRLLGVPEALEVTDDT